MRNARGRNRSKKTKVFQGPRIDNRPSISSPRTHSISTIDGIPFDGFGALNRAFVERNRKSDMARVRVRDLCVFARDRQIKANRYRLPSISPRRRTRTRSSKSTFDCCHTHVWLRIRRYPFSLASISRRRIRAKKIILSSRSSSLSLNLFDLRRKHKCVWKNSRVKKRGIWEDK